MVFDLSGRLAGAVTALVDGLAEALQQPGLARHQLLQRIPIDLQRGDLTDGVRAAGHGFAGQSRLADEAAPVQEQQHWARTDRDSASGAASGGADIEFIPAACLYGMDQTRRG